MTGIHGQKRFAQGAWELGGGQPAALRDAAARMLGTILQSHVIGSHRVFACAVSRVTLGQEPHALVYGNRRFGAVAYMEE
jgi:flavin reductase (DIM6/NTAB) family NADH-FMN oxidoreductase RutF